MLLIFDLDDTLIDRSGSLGPIKLCDALHVMQKEGLLIDSEEKAITELIAIDKQSTSGKATIRSFCKQHNQEQFVDCGIKEYYSNFDFSNLQVPCLPATKETLKKLKEQGHTLAIVSHGVPEQQMQKIIVAGIDQSLFTTIYITEKLDKELYYQKLLQENNFSKDQTVVIGDSIERDLLPAKELGIHTIHIRQGRGKNMVYTQETMPSFSISSLKELFAILNTFS